MNKIASNHQITEEAKLRLRKQAECVARENVALSAQVLEDMPLSTVRALVHELQVHQIELEIQNETLRQTQLQLIALQARYFDLYDMAPISYCTVNESGIILEANLATAELFSEKRSNLVGQRISRYIDKDFQDVYYLSCKLLSATGTQQNCELHILKAHEGNPTDTNEDKSATLWVNVAIALAKDENGRMVQRMMLTDITDAKIMAMAMQQSESRLRALVDSHH